MPPFEAGHPSLVFASEQPLEKSVSVLASSTYIMAPTKFKLPDPNKYLHGLNGSHRLANANRSWYEEHDRTLTNCPQV